MNADVSEPQSLSMSDGGHGFQLSSQQRRQWAVMNDGESPHRFRSQCIAWLRARERTLEPARVTEAFRRLLGRHEVLRSTYKPLAGLSFPLQVVSSEPDFIASTFRLEGEPEFWRAEFAARLEAEVRRASLRPVLLVASGSIPDLLCGISLPAIMADLASVQILLREVLFALAQEEGPAGNEALQYPDFTEWERHIFASTEARPGIESWAAIDARIQGAAAISLERRPAPGAVFAPEQHVAFLPGELADALRAWAAEAHVGEGTIVLTLFLAYLGKLQPADTKLVGIMHAGRKLAELGDAVGPYTKHLPVVLPYDPACPLHDAVQLVAGELANADALQETFDAAEWAARRGRGDGVADLHCLFEYDDLPPAQRAGDVVAEVVARSAVANPFRLRLAYRRLGREAQLELGYDARVFSRQAAELVTKHLVVLLTRAIAERTTPLGELTFHSKLDSEITHPLRTPRMADAGGPLLHEAVSAWACRRGETQAVVCGARALTYRELDLWSDQLAHVLRTAHGVNHGTVVALAADKGVELIVGMLGILKAGGCYLPLDPRLPRERQAYMVRDCGCELLLCTDDSRAAAALNTGCRVLSVGRIDDACTADLPSVNADAAAYIIYTSGTTGLPKGVVVEHRNIRAYAVGLRAGLGELGCRSFATLTSVATDLGNTAIFGALYEGATLHLIPEPIVADIAALGAYFSSHEIDGLKTVPSHYQSLLAAAGEQAALLVPRICLVLGGEPCPAPLVAHARKMRPAITVINHYGPTETTVGVLVHRVGAEELSDNRVPLSQAIGGSHVALVDPLGNPVAVGVAGELCIAGPQVARGYLNSPVGTSDRFGPLPGLGSGCWYRTGDVARWQADGSLDLLGRNDQQVKIRGHRIELREVELAFERLVGVEQAIVLPVERTPGTLVLAAFVKSAEPRDEASMLAAVADFLPEPMVPSAALLYARFPVTHSGKLDRDALKSDFVHRNQRSARVTPRNAVEEKLCMILGAVLNTDGVGADDDYFKLGGDSIKALQVVHQLRKAGLTLQVADLFEHRTVEKLAAFLLGRGTTNNDIPVTPENAPRNVIEIDRGAVAVEVRRATGKSLDEVADVFGLTPTQEGMLFHALYDEGALPYINQGILELEGNVDPRAMRRRIEQMVIQHEMLRTNILHEGLAIPVQVVWHSPEIDFTFVDLTAKPDAAARVGAYEVSDRMKRFNLAAEPLIRTRLFQTAPHRFTLIVTTHHIILDGWCMAVLAAQFLSTHEEAASQGGARVPYRAYIEWLTRQDAAAAASFWKDHFACAREAAPTCIPRRFRIEPRAKHDRSEVHRRLSSSVTRQIVAAASELGVTLNTVVQTAWAVVLHRYGAGKCVVFGNVVSGRPAALEGFDRIVGSFINTVPLVVQVTADATFRALATTVQRDFRQCDRFGYLPLPELQRASECDAARFDHLYAFESYAADVNLAGARFGGSDGFTVAATRKFGYSNYDLNFMVIPGEELEFAFVVNRSTIDEQMVGAMAAAMEAVLLAAAADPDVVVREIDLINAADRRQMLEEYNATATSYPTGILLHELVEEAVERWPEAAAVASGDTTLSYRQLNGRANDLAHVLRHQHGLRPGRVVAVFATQSVDMVVMVLAILKAGGVYVPLSPDHPAERNRYMILDSKAELVVADFDAPRSPGEIPWLNVNRLAASVRSAENPERTREPTDLAYIIYTSGTTGRPKGVAIEHRAVVNTLLDVNHRFGIAAGDGVLGVSSLTFDLSVYDIFGILAAGGKLVVPTADEARAPVRWRELIHRHGLTVWNSVPALMQLLLDPTLLEDTGKPLPLRVVMLSGDWIPVTLPEEISRQCRSARVMSLGGATEASIWSIHYPIECVEPGWPSIPYGKPLGNQSYYVCDADLNPCPFYVEGELYIGGQGLARGYYGDEVKTRAAFITHPRTRLRLYRTGDLGRHLPGGLIEFRGRRDTQVKVNGYRIELGEVEAALLRHGPVKRAVAAVHGTRDGDRRLWAYYESDREIPAAEFKDVLGPELPRHMIPHVFVRMQDWPLTANGKLDREKLPTTMPPEAEGAEPCPDALPLRPEHAILLDVFKAVLRRPAIRLDDDFFAIGGDSIKAIQAVSRLRPYGYALTVADLFRHPRLRDCGERMKPLPCGAPSANPSTIIPVAELQHDDEAEIMRRFA